MARKKKDRERSGKLVEEVLDELDDVGPATQNNRIKRFVKKLRER